MRHFLSDLFTSLVELNKGKTQDKLETKKLSPRGQLFG